MNKIIFRIGIILLSLIIIGGWAFFFISQKGKIEPGNQIPKIVAVGEEAPEVNFLTFDGKEKKLSQFRGKPVIFWLIATWCPTCAAGTQVLTENISEIEKYDLQIITLKVFENLGYPGPSIEEFGRENAKEFFSNQNFFWGDASRETSFLYDPRGFPDIYFLIDKEGIIRLIDTAPSATINKIINFAKSQ